MTKIIAMLILLFLLLAHPPAFFLYYVLFLQKDVSFAVFVIFVKKAVSFFLSNLCPFLYHTSFIVKEAELFFFTTVLICLFNLWN